MKKQFIQLLFAVGVVSTLGACKDFQEINKDPNAVDEASVPIDYLLNKSVIDAQMNPDVAERMFILNWDRVSGYEHRGGLTVFSPTDDWANSYFSIGYMNGWLKHATLAITLGTARIADPAYPEPDKPRVKNIVQMARIWRAYLYSEFSDNFGPVAISQFDGLIETEMTSVEDVYKFLLTELSEAVETIDTKVELNTTESRNDIFFSGNLSKWKRYANSMRMRFAMRIGNQAEFEAAVSHPAGYVSEAQYIPAVEEKGGWDPTTAVMSRSWNQQQLSLAFANITVGLGGVEVKRVQNIAYSGVNGMSEEQYNAYVKDPQHYLGLKMENYIAPSTNVMNVQYLMDFVPNYSDPRLYLLFSVPGVNNKNANKYPLEAGQEIFKIFLADQGTDVPKVYKQGSGAKPDTVLFRAQCNMAVVPAGSSKNYGTNFVNFTNEPRNRPTKNVKWRNADNNNGNKRVFFGPWESYFLIAEAALKGWTVPMTDQAAYNKGIEESFSWHGISGLAGEYTSSQAYSRVGTSVAYNHTAEAADFTIDYVDFQSNLEEVAVNGTVKTYRMKANPTVSQVTYKYPKGRYETNNDKLTKIITQKYLANAPYLPNEAWNDYRRLNLPFIENPVVEEPITLMPWYSKENSGQFVWENVPQRIPYPTSMQSTNPSLWSSGLQQLGGVNVTSTKLPWAIGK